MQQRLPSLLDPPIAFAHRGARAHAPDNTIDSFLLALRLGATAIESDVWVTADGVAVLDHDGVVRRGIRRTPISEMLRADLPEHVPTLDELFDRCGADYDLSLDVCTTDAYGALVDVLRRRPEVDRSKVWLCDPVVDNLIERRDDLHDMRLVHSARLSKLSVSPELHAARLRASGIDAVNMHQTDWNGGLVVLFHRFEILAFSWDLQFEYALENAFRMGIDAVYSDHTDTMVDVLSKEIGSL